MSELNIPPTVQGLTYAIAFAVVCFGCAAVVEKVVAWRKRRLTASAVEHSASGVTERVPERAAK